MNDVIERVTTLVAITLSTAEHVQKILGKNGHRNGTFNSLINTCDDKLHIHCCLVTIEYPTFYMKLSLSTPKDDVDGVLRIRLDFMSTDLELLSGIKTIVEDSIMFNAKNKGQLYSSKIISGYYRAEANLLTDKPSKGL